MIDPVVALAAAGVALAAVIAFLPIVPRRPKPAARRPKPTTLTITVTADTKPAQAALEAVARKAEDVHARVSGSLAEIRPLLAQLDRVESGVHEIAAKVQAAGADTTGGITPKKPIRRRRAPKTPQS